MREELFKNCTLCPRKCNVNRLEGKRGYCGMAAGCSDTGGLSRF